MEISILEAITWIHIVVSETDSPTLGSLPFSPFPFPSSQTFSSWNETMCKSVDSIQDIVSRQCLGHYNYILLFIAKS